jgi:hypothetical protein
MDLRELGNGLRGNLRANILTLNLGFLHTAHELVTSGHPTDARLLLGVREPLLSWLRDADVAKLFLLASSRELLYEVRLPPDMEERILTTCQDGGEGQWLAAMHLALVTTEGSDGRAD